MRVRKDSPIPAKARYLRLRSRTLIRGLDENSLLFEVASPDILAVASELQLPQVV